MEKCFDRLVTSFLFVLLGFSIHGIWNGIQTKYKLGQKPTELIISLDETPGPAILQRIQCPLCKRTAKLVEINQNISYRGLSVSSGGDIYDCGTHETECKHGT